MLSLGLMTSTRETNIYQNIKRKYIDWKIINIWCCSICKDKYKAECLDLNLNWTTQEVTIFIYLLHMRGHRVSRSIKRRKANTLQQTVSASSSFSRMFDYWPFISFPVPGRERRQPCCTPFTKERQEVAAGMTKAGGDFGCLTTRGRWEATWQSLPPCLRCGVAVWSLVAVPWHLPLWSLVKKRGKRTWLYRQWKCILELADTRPDSPCCGCAVLCGKHYK